MLRDDVRRGPADRTTTSSASEMLLEVVGDEDDGFLQTAEIASAQRNALLGDLCALCGCFSSSDRKQLGFHLLPRVHASALTARP